MTGKRELQHEHIKTAFSFLHSNSHSVLSFPLLPQLSIVIHGCGYFNVPPIAILGVKIQPQPRSHQLIQKNCESRDLVSFQNSGGLNTIPITWIS